MAVLVHVIEVQLKLNLSLFEVSWIYFLQKYVFSQKKRKKEKRGHPFGANKKGCPNPRKAKNPLGNGRMGVEGHRQEQIPRQMWMTWNFENPYKTKPREPWSESRFPPPTWLHSPYDPPPVSLSLSQRHRKDRHCCWVAVFYVIPLYFDPAKQKRKKGGVIRHAFGITHSSDLQTLGPKNI